MTQDKDCQSPPVRRQLTNCEIVLQQVLQGGKAYLMGLPEVIIQSRAFRCCSIPEPMTVRAAEA